MDLEGKLLGNRYEIIEKIGNGGMATVYKAKCHVLNRYVAVKILKDEFTTDQEFIKRFEVEAQAAASITHPNIVSVYDVGKDGNLYYIVMELIQGKTLKEIILEEHGPLPWKWSINIAIQIASALEVAHKNNIVDIKPHNIIITEDGVAKVTDFGIAKAVSNSTITAFGTTIGSVHYFSPEQARGGYTDAKSDIYSLGVVLYEMLTGKVPFDADTPVSVALKHIQEEPIAPKQLNEKIPQAANDIILKAMRKDTNLRYQSVTLMLKDLKQVLKDPDGDFVDNLEYVPDMETRKISTKEIEEEAKNIENNKKKKPGKLKAFVQKHKGLSIFLAIIILFALSLGGTILFFKLTNPAEVIMPNLVGMSKEDATKLLDESKLKLEVSSEEYNSEYAEGYIISQDPLYSDNYNIKEGSTIKVVVSKGIEEAIVPKVIGMSEDDAIKALEKAKLKYQIVEEESKKIEAGYVISQETEQDSKVYAGDTVVIHVSTGVKKSSVVSVIGKTEEEAKKALEDLGLKVTVAYEEDSSKDNGVVLKQSIDAGKEVEQGSSITITVNKLTEMKYANLMVNVKKLLEERGKQIEYEETNTTNTANGTISSTNKVMKKVEVKISVDGDSATYTIDPTTTNLYHPIYGKGTVQVKVYIDGDWYSTKDVNLNNTTSITIE